jgi:hypothetical protein
VVDGRRSRRPAPRRHRRVLVCAARTLEQGRTGTRQPLAQGCHDLRRRKQARHAGRPERLRVRAESAAEGSAERAGTGPARFDRRGAEGAGRKNRRRRTRN